MRCNEKKDRLKRLAGEITDLTASPCGREGEGMSALVAVGWVSVAAGAVALGVYVGHEIRSRYKFKRRTPYDFFSHMGDDGKRIAENFGVGI